MHGPFDRQARCSGTDQEDETLRIAGHFPRVAFGLFNACRPSQRECELVHESTIGQMEEIRVSIAVTPPMASHLPG